MKLAWLDENGISWPGNQDIFYGWHKISGKIEQDMEKGEITDQQKSKISLEASDLLKQIVESPVKDKYALAALCELYVQGRNLIGTACMPDKNEDASHYRYILLRG